MAEPEAILDTVVLQQDNAFGIFILPPDEAILLERLRRRGREDEATIERRFAEARHEISVARSSGIFDAFVTNDDLDRVVADVTSLVRDRWTGS